MENSLPTEAPRRWPLFMFGVLLFVLGPVIYFVQMRIPQFVVPWHVPILGTLGVACMAVSVGQRRGLARSAGLVLFVLLCGLEWFFVLVLTKTPVYAGPAVPGQKVPAFAAVYADGRPFTQADLEKGDRTVMLFFRGRW